MSLAILQHLSYRTVAVIAIITAFAASALADETCNSPYMAKLIKGQEDYVYVWTLGVEGLGDGSDKLVTIGVNPKSPRAIGEPYSPEGRKMRGKGANIPRGSWVSPDVHDGAASLMPRW